MRTFVMPIGLGMGDVLISLPVIQSLLDDGEEVYLVTRSSRQVGLSRCIIGLQGEVAESQWQPHSGDRVINLRDHPLQTEHNWASLEFAQYFGEPRMERIIEKIARDFSLSTNYQQLTKLSCKTVDGLSNTIILIPASDGFYKHWPTASWLKVAQALQADNIDVAVLGELNHSRAVEDLIKAGLIHLATDTIDDAIDLISSCLAVASVDTGLMHIAVQQGVPTCALVHPRNIHHRSAANCFIFQGQSCPSHCLPGFVQRPDYAAASHMNVELKYDRRYCTLSDQENCMAAIAPDVVLEKLREISVLQGQKSRKQNPQIPEGDALH